MSRIRLKIPSNPQIDQLSKSFQEEQPLTVNIEKNISDAISEWCDSLPPNAHQKLKAELKIQNVKTAPIQRFTVVTWHERRMTKKERVTSLTPKRNATLKNHDIWSFSYPLHHPSEVSERVEEFAVSDSLTRETCDSGCKSSGAVACPVCRGSHKVACETCQGRGKQRCTACSGKGYTTTWENLPGNNTREVKHPCTKCHSEGMQTCHTCHGTKTGDCKNCRAGAVVCGGCNGEGTKAYYENLTITQTPVVSFRSFFPERYKKIKSQHLPQVEPSELFPIEMPEIRKQDCEAFAQDQQQQVPMGSQFIGQHTSFEQTPGIYAEYVYESETYPVWFFGLTSRLETTDSPFRREAEKRLLSLKEKLARNEVIESLPEIQYLKALSNSPDVERSYTELMNIIHQNIEHSIETEAKEWRTVNAHRLNRVKYALGKENTTYGYLSESIGLSLKVLFFGFAGLMIFLAHHQYHYFSVPFLVGILLWAYTSSSYTAISVSRMRFGSDQVWKMLFIPAMLVSGFLWAYGLVKDQNLYLLQSWGIIFSIALIPRLQSKPVKPLKPDGDLLLFLHRELLPFKKYFNRPVKIQIKPETEEDKHNRALEVEQNAIKDSYKSASESLVEALKKKKK